MNVWHDIDPARITPEDFLAVIEIPKGSKKKYELDKQTGDLLEEIYRELDAPIIRKTVEVAEMIKYTCNVWHAAKVTFANEIGNIAKAVGVDGREVMDVICQDHKLNLVYIHSEKLTDANADEKLRDMDGVIVAPGFGQRGIEGKFAALKWCREHDVPTFGICLGMQCMVIEFARDVLGLENANSTEMDTKTPYNVIDLMEEQKSISNMGGTMRLGAYKCELLPGSKAAEAYGSAEVSERHRHRFEFNNDFLQAFEEGGMKCVGRNPQTKLVEVVEIPEKRWYVGTQYHPEYSSTVLSPHPLFISFIRAAIAYKADREK